MPEDRTRLVALVRRQAQACRDLGSPLFGDLGEVLADDLEAGGPSAAVLAGHERDPADAVVSLRLLGAVHRLVLSGRAPALAAHFPSAGGTYVDRAAAATAFLGVLEDQADSVRPLLDVPPQTNEVGRAAALTGGLLHVADRWELPVRLLEIGTSGALNLRADRYRYEAAEGSAWGDPASPVVLRGAWEGRLPPLHARLEVVERVGCDRHPVDVTTEEGRLAIRSYVWPDQLDRLARLSAAFEVAQVVPVDLVRTAAGAFLASSSLLPGTVTVLWHSVMWQYVEEGERRVVEQQLDRLGAAAHDGAPFVRLSFEPVTAMGGVGGEFFVTMTTWPSGRTEVLGTAAPHGVPVVWAEVDASGAGGGGS